MDFVVVMNIDERCSFRKVSSVVGCVLGCMCSERGNEFQPVLQKVMCPLPGSTESCC